MSASVLSHTKLLGYLTFVEFAAHGVVGGFLLVNEHARPVEFHCTAPIRASRAQEILYGPTLHEFVYADQIAKTLLEQPGRQPDLVFTDRAVALATRSAISFPLVHLLSRRDLVEESSTGETVASTQDYIRIGEYWAEVANGYVADGEQAVSLMAQACWDIHEPFERIREAITEAQRAAA